MKKDYPVADWNIYPLHFGDGDDWSQSDNRTCMKLLKDGMLPIVNQFSYAQVDSQYGSGQFIEDRKENFADHEEVALSRVANRDAILYSIRELLGRGK